MARSRSGFWDRASGYDEISANTFNLIATIVTVYGLGLFGWFAAMNAHAKLNGWEYLGLFVVSMIGALMAASDTVALSCVGLTVMAAAMGAYCGPFIGQYKVASVVDIAMATILVTLVLGAAGTIYPKSLENWGSLLFIALLGLIGVQFTELFFAMFGIFSNGVHTLVGWLGVILFSGYIVFDFNRAQNISKNMENAINVGVNIFLDVVNLFIRLLEIFGQKSDD